MAMYPRLWSGFVSILVSGIRLWKLASFGVVPILLVCHYTAGMFGDDTIDHHKRPPFVKYDHLRVRTKVSYRSRTQHGQVVLLMYHNIEV